jgi:tetratricopeptide (TPR) repeat protein
MANLASTWRQQGRSDEAEQLQIEVLELYKEVLSTKHPDTILAMANLASTWRQQGRSDETEQLDIEVLELYKEVLGTKHPDTIRAIANLAATWRQQGRSDQAEQLDIEVLELSKEVLGAKHPDTIRAAASRMAVERQSTLGGTDTRLPYPAITSSSNSGSTQQQIPRMKLYKRVGKWTKKLTHREKPKTSSNSDF